MKRNLLNDFSKHLFWDVERKNINLNIHSKYVIKNILEYGLLNDWNLIKEYYGLPKILEIVKTFRDLEPRALAYIATITKTPREKFRCYTKKQLNQPHWNF